MARAKADAPGGIWSSLRNRNFRVYLAGQGLSHAGLWVQQTAELWLLLELTGSGVALGLHPVLRHGPVVLFGIFGGLLGDRRSRRGLLILTQAVHMFSVSVVAGIALWPHAELTPLIIYVIVAVQGLVNAIDNPLRRSIVRDLTTDDELANAISLNSTTSMLSRTVGPAIGGLLIVTVGVEWCFAVNAVSYAAVLVSLLVIDPAKMRPIPLAQRGRGQLREGLRYAATTHHILLILLLVPVVATFAWSWNVILPAYVTAVFSGDASLYGIMVSVLSVGSVFGAVAVARMSQISASHVLGAALVAAAGLLMVAIAASLHVAFAGLAMLGAGSLSFSVLSQARLQLQVDDRMAGRVIALYSVVMVGARPAAGIFGGIMIDVLDPRWAFGVGGLIVVASVATTAVIRVRRRATLNGSPSRP